MEPSGFGRYAYLLNLATLLALVRDAGLRTLVMRERVACCRPIGAVLFFGACGSPARMPSPRSGRTPGRRRPPSGWVRVLPWLAGLLSGAAYRAVGEGWRPAVS